MYHYMLLSSNRQRTLAKSSSAEKTVSHNDDYDGDGSKGGGHSIKKETSQVLCV